MNGDVVSFQSVAFPNRYIRLDYTTCPSSNCLCATANVQYSIGPWEKFNLIKQSNGTFCIRANDNNNVYLSFDGSGCTAPNGSGCGIVSAIYSTDNSCSGKEAFRFINLYNGKYGIASDWQPQAYLRLNGSNISSPQSNGGGVVNGQYYAPGTLPANWELFTISTNLNYPTPVVIPPLDVVL
jgi:phospholipase C